MKILKTYAIGILLCICSLQSTAQKDGAPIREPEYNRPKLFKDLPDQLSLSIAVIEPLFQLETGKAVSIPFTPSFNYQGVVVSKANNGDEQVKSVVVRSVNRLGSVLALSRVVDEDGTVYYRGQIISMQHGDAYEVVSHEGKIQLNKKDFYDLQNE